MSFFKAFCFLLVSTVVPCALGQQTILTDSNLPIMLIQTDTNSLTNALFDIIDDPKVPARMKLLFRPNGSRNYLVDSLNTAYLNYDGKIGIELRGSSSQFLPKKPYGFETRLADNIANNNVSLLNMPSENDWVLNALAFDPSMIRDYLSYTLASSMGNYTPRVRYVELVVNGDYKGVYMLTEKIKIDSDRVNLLKLTTTDNAPSTVTGGYIVKADKLTGGDVAAWEMPNYGGWHVEYLHDNPSTANITVLQDNYIENVFTSLANNTNPINSSLIDGYTSIIDVPSFIDYIIMAEIASNPDAYCYSTYFHKDRNGKLRAGPIWDFNLSYGNDLFAWGYDRSLYDIWQFEHPNYGSKFWKDLFDDSNFKCYLARRWFELTAANEPFNYNSISTRIDDAVALLAEAQVREETRWGTVGMQSANIIDMKTWIQNRINWMNQHIGSSFNCQNVSTPNLVISKIHYHPLSENGYDSNDLEFIEITNNSEQGVSLTGYYIKELGISYQFPLAPAISGHQKIYLCNNATAFQNFYGFAAYGEYSRDLSNRSYNIVLSDAYGNVIDEVKYGDSAPWPAAADGTGSYLCLADINSDNSLAQNWAAEAGTLNSETYLSKTKYLDVYPNPTNSLVNFKVYAHDFSQLDLTIYDAFGKLLANYDLSDGDIQVNMDDLSAGVYHYCVRSEAGIIDRNKIIKQ